MNKIILVCLFSFLILTNVGLAEVTEGQGVFAINEAEDYLAEMSEVNFSTLYIQDILNEANDAMEYERYDVVISKANDIEERRNDAFDLYDSLTSLEKRIEDVKKKDVDTTDIEKIYEQAKVEFNNENYERSEEFIDECVVEISEAEAYTSLLNAQVKRLRSNIVYFIVDNIFWILLALAITIPLFHMFYKKYYKIYLREKITSLNREKKILKKLMIKAQEQRYKKGIISDNVYRLRMDKYDEQDIEIDEEIKNYRKKLRKF